MYKTCFQIIVALVLAGFSSPALAQTMSVHDYHRGLKELNREMATIKEELRQERKARQRLEYQRGQSEGPSGEAPASAGEVERLARDRDILMEKVATLETRTRSRKEIFTDYKLYGTMFVEKLSLDKQDTESQSAIRPIFLSLSHQFNETTDLKVTLRKGSFSGSSALAVHNAYVSSKLRGDWSVEVGRFDLPLYSVKVPSDGLSGKRESTDPSHYHTVVPALYQQTFAPIGLTGDGAGFRLHQDRGLSASIHLHSGFEADLLDGRTGLYAMAAAEGRSFEKLGVTARVDYQSETTFAAGLTALYSGLARSADSFGLAKSPAGASMTGFLADARVKIIGLWLKAGIAHFGIEDSQQINALYSRGVGSAMSGFFVEGAFNLFSLGLDTAEELTMFLRYDQANTQQSTKGFTKSPANDRRQTAIGLNYTLAKGVTLKADHTILNDDSRATDDGSATRLGIGFSF